MSSNPPTESPRHRNVLRSLYISLTLNTTTLKVKIYGNELTVITVEHDKGYSANRSTMILRSISEIKDDEYPEYVRALIPVIKQLADLEGKLISIADSQVFYHEPDQ